MNNLNLLGMVVALIAVYVVASRWAEVSNILGTGLNGFQQITGVLQGRGAPSASYPGGIWFGSGGSGGPFKVG